MHKDIEQQQHHQPATTVFSNSSNMQDALCYLKAPLKYHIIQCLLILIHMGVADRDELWEWLF